MDEHMRGEIQRTALFQMLYTREKLREAASREKERAELDILRLWQLVYEAEEEEAALADKHTAMTEVVQTHCALKAMVLFGFSSCVPRLLNDRIFRRMTP